MFYAFSVSYKQYDRVPYAEIEQNADRFVNLCNDAADEQSVRNLLAYLNTKMTGDVSYIFDVYEKQMNFYNNDVFKVSQDEVLFDIGAYDGDTIRLFLDETNGKYKKIIALEPDDKSFLELNDYIAKNRMPDVFNLINSNILKDLKARGLDTLNFHDIIAFKINKYLTR